MPDKAVYSEKKNEFTLFLLSPWKDWKRFMGWSGLTNIGDKMG